MSTRAAIRQALAGLLREKLTEGSEPLVERVYAYQRGDFIERIDAADTLLTPVVVVTSAGSDYSQTGQSGIGLGAHHIEVHVFTLYANLASGWTEELGEERADAILAATYAALLAARRNPPHWQALSFAGPSQTSFVLIGDVTYRQEILPLTVRAPEVTP